MAACATLGERGRRGRRKRGEPCESAEATATLALAASRCAKPTLFKNLCLCHGKCCKFCRYLAHLRQVANRSVRFLFRAASPMYLLLDGPCGEAQREVFDAEFQRVSHAKAQWHRFWFLCLQWPAATHGEQQRQALLQQLQQPEALLGTFSLNFLGIKNRRRSKHKTRSRLNIVSYMTSEQEGEW